MEPSLAVNGQRLRRSLMNLARIGATETGVVSQHKIEHAKPKHLEAGCNVLLAAMAQTAGRAPGGALA